MKQTWEEMKTQEELLFTTAVGHNLSHEQRWMTESNVHPHSHRPTLIQRHWLRGRCTPHTVPLCQPGQSCMGQIQ